MKSKYINTVFFTLLMLAQGVLLNSCKKFVEVENPADQLNSDAVFRDSSTATSAITGIYSEMLTNRNLFSNSAVTLYTGMSADELYNYTPGLKDEFTHNQITQANHGNLDNSFWKPAYKNIYAANLAIEKLSQSQSLSGSLKNQLTGEAKLIRAFCYFQLLNLFGDVPLITASKYTENVSATRAPIASVYNQIINDLLDAKSLLPVDYTTTERVRPNKWAAAALLSRCYLYTGDWQNAEAEANAIISSGLYSLEPDLNNVFLNSSTEAIWQLMPVRPGFNTYEGLEILPVSASSTPTYLVTSSLRNAFETGDNRKTVWINSRVFNNDTLYYAFKYKIPYNTVLTEYYMVFRLAEQYLIRAEAALNQNKIPAAQVDINTIRARAGLANTLASDAPSLKIAIEQERHTELFCEWGHRWYDLKRTGRAGAVLAALKGANWQSTDTLWPVPQPEINLNPSLTQNPGY
ncbi:MAG: RagB/SusD family nutrient uptake outer membrane protein [Bacteroidetes bacterium]|nr:RagB/SusD family nutrient uptake outer membrane protein [Bacteroidota bacterium]